MHMGEVDKMYFYLQILHMFPKMTLHVFTHAIDIARVTSYLEYKQKATTVGVKKKNWIYLIY